jgi:hypothetical protein
VIAIRITRQGSAGAWDVALIAGLTRPAVDANGSGNGAQLIDSAKERRDLRAASSGIRTLRDASSMRSCPYRNPLSFRVATLRSAWKVAWVNVQLADG